MYKALLLLDKVYGMQQQGQSLHEIII